MLELNILCFLDKEFLVIRLFCIIFCFLYCSTNSDLTHLWEVVDVAKERLANSSSTCSSPGGTSTGYGGQLSTGRKAQRVVKASSTAPVITHTERPRSAHNEDNNAMKIKEQSAPGFLGIEDSFDKAISLPNSPVSKEQPLYDIEIKKDHETKKAQRRHHTHHLFDGILHTISGGTDETKTKCIDQKHNIQNISSELSENSQAISISEHDIDRSRWQQNKTSDTNNKINYPGTPAGLIRRWSETTSTTAKSPQTKHLKVH